MILPLLALAAAAQGAATAAAPSWRSVATRADTLRLHDWRDAFVAGLEEAKKAGKSADIARENELLEPDSATTGPALRPGRYRCRTLKLGSQGAIGGIGMVAYAPFTCTVTAAPDGVLRFEKTSGSQRPVGRLFADGDARQVFLGTMMLADEQRPIAYGLDRDRDMVGAVQNIGPNRWRMLLPYPKFESTLDIIELSPAS